MRLVSEDRQPMTDSELPPSVKSSTQTAAQNSTSVSQTPVLLTTDYRDCGWTSRQDGPKEQRRLAAMRSKYPRTPRLPRNSKSNRVYLHLNQKLKPNFIRLPPPPLQKAERAARRNIRCVPAPSECLDKPPQSIAGHLLRPFDEIHESSWMKHHAKYKDPTARDETTSSLGSCPHFMRPFVLALPVVIASIAIAPPQGYVTPPLRIENTTGSLDTEKED